MAPPRVRESCIPCRSRKSRCNAETPCSSCVLRGTEADCQLPSNSAAGPSRKPAAPKPARKSRPSSPAARKLGSRRSSSPPHRQATEQIVTPEEKARWQSVLAAIPPKSTCEILLEYLLTECDWLWRAPDVVGIWKRAISTGGIDPISAGLVYASLAFPSAMLTAEPSSLYRPVLRKDEAERLFGLAVECLPSRPSSIYSLDLALSIVDYLVFTGQAPQTKPFVIPAVEYAIQRGMFDESTEGWHDLTGEQRNDWRRISWGLFSHYRWSQLYEGDDPFQNLRLNLCRPEMTPRNLVAPIHLDLPACLVSHEASFRILRVRSSDELARISRYRQIMLDALDLIPRVVAFQRRIGYIEPEVLLRECEIVYRDLLFWLEYKLPSEQFGEPTPGDIDPTNLVSCRYAAQALVLNLVVGHMAANLLRHWLVFDEVGPSSPFPQRRMYAACLDNAKRIMGFIPTIKALVPAKHGPMTVPFMALNLFNAATSYAIPVLRAVRYWTSRDTQADISSMPMWPIAYPRNPPALQRTAGRLPISIYTDSTVKECATNILVILDGLSELKANPLGQVAERRLAALITQYGLRDAASVAESYPCLYDPANDPTLRGHHDDTVDGTVQTQTQISTQPLLPYPNTGIPTGLGSDHSSFQQPVVGPTLIAGQMGESAGTTDDFTFLSSLLQMDESIWEGLLEAGVMTRTDGQGQSV